VGAGGGAGRVAITGESGGATSFDAARGADAAARDGAGEGAFGAGKVQAAPAPVTKAASTKSRLSPDESRTIAITLPAVRQR
jgi:hypothetical protein